MTVLSLCDTSHFRAAAPLHFTWEERAGKNKDVKVVLGETVGNKMHFNFNGPNAMVRRFKMPSGDDNEGNGNMDMGNLPPFQAFSKTV